MNPLMKFLSNPKTVIGLALCTAVEFSVLAFGARPGLGQAITSGEVATVSGGSAGFIQPPQTTDVAALQLFGVVDGASVYGRLIERQVSTIPLSNVEGLIPPRPEIKASVDASLANLDGVIRQAPKALVALATSIRDHGLAALAYTDPVAKEEADKLGILLGRGLRQMGDAVAADMILTARDAVIQGGK